MSDENRPDRWVLLRHWRGEIGLVLVVVALIAIVVVVAAVRPEAEPGETAAAAQTTTSSPSPAASETTAGPPSPSSPAVAAIPDNALLTGADLRAPFIGVTVPFLVPYTPNPFTTCAGDGIPGGQQPVAMRALAFDNATSLSLVGGEWVARFAPGGAQLTIGAIGAVLSGPCAGKFDVQSGTLGGDESILAHSADPATVIPQSAHGVAIYYAILRHGDYLVWITLFDQSKPTGEASFATSLVQRAEQRACDALAC